jgi:hypothetical protein
MHSTVPGDEDAAAAPNAPAERNAAALGAGRATQGKSRAATQGKSRAGKAKGRQRLHLPH